jgi:hypothetical protein
VKRLARRLYQGSSPRTRWGRGLVLTIAAALTALVPALSYVGAAGGSAAVVGQWRYFSTRTEASGYVVSRMGCVRNRTADALGRAFARRMGPLIGEDNPHAIRLGPRRTLWLFSDAFVDTDNSAATLRDARMVANVLVLQRRRCFRLIRSGTDTQVAAFQPPFAGMPDGRVFWPLGGEAHGDRLFIFWAEMQATPPPPPGDGIYRYPVRTWLGTYDRTTFARIRMRPAPNAGVRPQYGYGVASDRRHTYLFGNSNLLNLEREGGFYSGPHSATRMWLARVPRGRLGASPRYRTATGWSLNPRAARPFSVRFWTENGMQPRYMAGHWMSVTKVDGLWGTRTIFEVARRPWGPWTVVSRRTIRPFRGYDDMNNYHPIIVPHRDPMGNLIIMMSQNARNWLDAVNDPSMYRPQVYTEPWPFRRTAGQGVVALARANPSCMWM